MTGWILSAEQVRTAPPEVRQWLRSVLEAELGPNLEAGHAAEAQHVLTSCTLEEARGILARIRDNYLATQIFFELGREPAGPAMRPDHLHRTAVLDVVRHARLSNLHQLGECLEVILAAFRELRGDANAELFVSDGRGAIYVHEGTHAAIARLWQELVAANTSVQSQTAQAMPMPGIDTLAAE